jgi:hypothetical protein
VSSPGQMLGFQHQLLKKPGQAIEHERKQVDERKTKLKEIWNGVKCLKTTYKSKTHFSIKIIECLYKTFFSNTRSTMTIQGSGKLEDETGYSRELNIVGTTKRDNIVTKEVTEERLVRCTR